MKLKTPKEALKYVNEENHQLVDIGGLLLVVPPDAAWFMTLLNSVPQVHPAVVAMTLTGIGLILRDGFGTIG